MDCSVEFATPHVLRQLRETDGPAFRSEQGLRPIGVDLKDAAVIGHDDAAEPASTVLVAN